MKFKKIINKPKKWAFSVAEAMVTLLIVSLALSAAAPIFTKRSKATNTNMTSDTVNQLIDAALKTAFGESVVFFQNENCPPNWEKVTGLNGRFIRVAGEVKIDSRSSHCTWGIHSGYHCTVNDSVVIPNGYNATYNDAIRNIQGSLGYVPNMYPWDPYLVDMGGALDQTKTTPDYELP